MEKIKRIICCCGHGLGTSLIIRLNIERVLEKHGIKGISVSHTTLTDLDSYRADLVIVGLDVAKSIKSDPRVIVLMDLMSFEELEEKLLKALHMKDE